MVIQIVDLHKSIKGQEILRGVNLVIPNAQATAIIGRSGGGKSVLLRHLVGLMKPDKGNIFVDNVDITLLRKKELRKIQRRFGMVFQGAALFDSLTVYDNVAFPLRELTDTPEKEVRKIVADALKEVGLLERDFNKYPDEISGGMKKRVGMARALMADPEFMFFDEPTTGLDPVTEGEIHKLMQKCMTMLRYSRVDRSRIQCTEVLVSHNMREVMKLANLVAVLHEGRIIEHTTPSELLKSDNPVIRRFVGEGMS